MQHIKSILKKMVILLSFTWLYSAQAQNPFVENKGQLPSHVISKTDLPSGVLFIEKAKLTYVFYNGQQLKEKHDRQLNQENIDAHAYTVSFLNTNNWLPSPDLNWRVSMKDIIILY